MDRAGLLGGSGKARACCSGEVSERCGEGGASAESSTYRCGGCGCRLGAWWAVGEVTGSDSRMSSDRERRARTVDDVRRTGPVGGQVAVDLCTCEVSRLRSSTRFTKDKFALQEGGLIHKTSLDGWGRLWGKKAAAVQVRPRALRVTDGWGWVDESTNRASGGGSGQLRGFR